MLTAINIIQIDGGIAQNPANSDGDSGLLVYTQSGTSGTYEATTSGIFNIYTKEQSLDFTTNTSALYYHISEYFETSEYPLTVGIYFSAPTTFSEISSIQNFAEGRLKLIGIWDDYATYASIDNIKTKIIAIDAMCNFCQSDKFPLQALYTAYSSTAISSLTTLKTSNSPSVSYFICEDTGNETVQALRISRGKWVGSIGKMLGNVSRSAVQDCAGWIKKYNLNTGASWANSGFIDGSLLSSYSRTQLNALDNLGYLFTIKKVGSTGTYLNNSWTCTSDISNFNTIERNRIWKKAFRNLYSVFLEDENGTIDLNSDGTIAISQIAYFVAKGEQALNGMFLNKEVNNYSFVVDANQKPLLNGGKIQVIGKIQPKGITKLIEVPLGFTANI